MMISDERLAQLIFAASHNGLHDEHAVKYFHGVKNGSGQVKLTCSELTQILEPYLERRTAEGNNEKSVQDSTGIADEVSK